MPGACMLRDSVVTEDFSAVLCCLLGTRHGVNPQVMFPHSFISARRNACQLSCTLLFFVVSFQLKLECIDRSRLNSIKSVQMFSSCCRLLVGGQRQTDVREEGNR
jgi:hypothetical protein